MIPNRRRLPAFVLSCFLIVCLGVSQTACTAQQAASAAAVLSDISEGIGLAVPAIDGIVAIVAAVDPGAIPTTVVTQIQTASTAVSQEFAGISSACSDYSTALAANNAAGQTAAVAKMNALVTALQADGPKLTGPLSTLGIPEVAAIVAARNALTDEIANIALLVAQLQKLQSTPAPSGTSASSGYMLAAFREALEELGGPTVVQQKVKQLSKKQFKKRYNKALKDVQKAAKKAGHSRVAAAAAAHALK